LEYPGPTISRDEIIKPASARDKDLLIQQDIDCDRLVVEKSKSTKVAAKSNVKSSYSHNELKAMAERANIKKSQSKPKLVEALRKIYC
jgi:hypothetical protein